MKKYLLFFGLVQFLFLIPGYSSGQQVDTIVFQPGPANGIDADIRDSRPDTPDGTSYDFIANAWTAQGDFFIQRSLIRFDLTPIPTNVTVLEATLKLTTNLNTGHYQMDSGPNPSYFLRVLTDWDKNQVTWNTQPAVSMNNPVIVPQSTSNTETYYLDLTNHVQDMVSHPESNFGWLFRQQTEERYRCLVFASSDNPMAGWRPKLTVIYTLCPVPVASFYTTLNQLEVTFHETSSNATSWTWDFGDGATSNDQNPVHTYPAIGAYQVCMTASNSCGSSVKCQNVDVTCSIPTVQFTYYLTNQEVQFFDTSSSTTVISRYWDFGDTTYSTAHNPVHTYNTGLYVYYVCFTATDSCGSGSVCDSVYVEPPMKPRFTSESNIANDLEVNFHGQSEGAVSWDWSFGDGTHSSLQNPTYLFPAFGNYQVCINVTNPLGTNSSCDSLMVLRKEKPNEIDPGTIYPNPTDGTLKIKFTLDIPNVNIFFFNNMGTMIHQYEFSAVKAGAPLLIDLSGYPKGIYLVKIGTDKTNRTEKVVLK